MVVKHGMKRRIFFGSILAASVFAVIMVVDNRYFESRAWDRLRG